MENGVVFSLYQTIQLIKSEKYWKLQLEKIYKYTFTVNHP